MELPVDRPLRLITSTVAEIENLMQLLLEAAAAGRKVDVLYGVPFSMSALHRIKTLNRAISNAMKGAWPRTSPISLLLDTVSHLDLLARDAVKDETSVTGVFIKIDTGYHRAGIPADSETFKLIINRLSQSKEAKLRGFYSHLGHSYSFSTPEESLAGLMTEIRVLLETTEAVMRSTSFLRHSSSDSDPIILSVGATPTTTAAQNLLTLAEDEQPMKEWRSFQKQLYAQHCELELHAGVYAFLDLQQVATGARPAKQPGGANQISATLSVQNIAIRVLAEVASVYNERVKKEALIAAGSLALGREPCKSYPGWGIVTPWRPLVNQAVSDDGMASIDDRYFDPAASHNGWIVGRISQEHGILTYESDGGTVAPEQAGSEFTVGDKVLIWPNHACVTAAAHGWYFVVDSDSNNADLVRDVWVRWRGW
jgi:D-serine deaminase-like pyridoxal phosphate-dependent protein